MLLLKVITEVASPTIFPAVHSSTLFVPRTVLEKFMCTLRFDGPDLVHDNSHVFAWVRIGPAQVTLLPLVLT